MLEGSRIKERRVLCGLSQDKLGHYIGQDGQYISKLERGIRTNITTETLELLAATLVCSTDYLLGRTDYPEPHPRKRQRDAEDSPEPRALRPAHGNYLLTTNLELIEQLTGVKPGLVDPQDPSPYQDQHPGELVQGYWLVPYDYHQDEQGNIEHIWQLFTWQQTFVPRNMPHGRAYALLHRVNQDSEKKAVAAMQEV